MTAEQGLSLPPSVQQLPDHLVAEAVPPDDSVPVRRALSDSSDLVPCAQRSRKVLPSLFYFAPDRAPLASSVIGRVSVQVRLQWRVRTELSKPPLRR